MDADHGRILPEGGRAGDVFMPHHVDEASAVVERT